MCSAFHHFVYVFHLIKFVSFCCYRIFLVNKDIHYRVKLRENVTSNFQDTDNSLIQKIRQWLSSSEINGRGQMSSKF